MFANLVEIAAAGLGAGAEAAVSRDTSGMAITPKMTLPTGLRTRSRRSSRAGDPAGRSSRGHDCRGRFRGATGPGGPPVAIVGVGGISNGLDAVEFLLAGADAVEVGTASLRDPRAP